MNDLTDRLRAANPVQEPPALPPVEPLLARLSDAPARRPRRRRVLVPALVAGLLVAIVAGLELRRPGVDVVAEARAALGGSGGVVHIVAREERFNPDGTLVQGSGGTSEIWSARDPLRFRIRERGGESAYADGVLTSRQDGGPVQSTRLDEQARRSIEAMDANTSFLQPGRDPLSVVRRLLADGTLQPAGTAELAGRRVQRLTGTEPAPDARTPAVAVEYLVDAETYAPLRLSTTATLKDGRPAGSSRRTFLEYERLPLSPANEALLSLG
jgi:hypothetical protein